MLNMELNKAILGIVAIPVVYWIFKTVKWIRNLDKIRSRVNSLPGPPLTFILGNYPQVRHSIFKFFNIGVECEMFDLKAKILTA